MISFREYLEEEGEGTGPMPNLGGPGTGMVKSSSPLSATQEPVIHLKKKRGMVAPMARRNNKIVDLSSHTYGKEG